MSTRLVTAALLLALLAPAAHGATLSTAAMKVEVNDRAQCVIVNVGKKTILIKSLELIGFRGQAFAEIENTELDPRRTLSISVGPNQHGVGDDPMFCQAEIGGPAKSARLTICTSPSFGPCSMVLE
jgi:hypothetical protein